MRRVVMLALFAACSSTPATHIPDGPPLDAHVDAPADAPPDAAGSGSDAMAFQASPRDRGLDATVLVFGFAIVMVPVPRKRRRRA